MSELLELSLEALRSHGCSPRRCGYRWSCLCPAHDDTLTSLSFSTSEDGQVLLIGHAGCTMADLFAAPPDQRNRHGPPKKKAPAALQREGASKGISVYFTPSDLAHGAPPTSCRLLRVAVPIQDRPARYAHNSILPVVIRRANAPGDSRMWSIGMGVRHDHQ